MIVSGKKNQFNTLISIDFYQGEKVLELMREEGFASEWNKLLDSCPWGSVFQNLNFVHDWYKNYKDKYLPVLIVARSGSQLVGFLPLAIENYFTSKSKKKLKLFGAGHFFALYQSWICKDEDFEKFGESIFRELNLRYPSHSLNLKFIPPQIPISRLMKIPYLKSNAVLETYRNPVLNYQSEYQSIFKKRHFRAKFNRINRAGKLVFKRVLDKETLEPILQKIEVFQDLRQGAQFNKSPFQTDPIQKKMFMDWMENGMLYVVVLMLDDEIVGALILANDNNKIAHLSGLISFNPIYGKFSPGLINLYLLGQKLQEEGFQQLKFSPGYDQYKDRFNNENEEITELFVNGNFAKRQVRILKRRYRAILIQKGYRPLDIYVKINKSISFFKKQIRNILFRPIFYFLKGVKDNEISSNEFLKKNIELKKLRFNQLEDLLYFDENNFKITRWEFLKDALKRIENGQSFYTYIEKNQLLACIWIEDKGDDQKVKLELKPKYWSGRVLKVYFNKELKNELVFKQLGNFS